MTACHLGYIPNTCIAVDGWLMQAQCEKMPNGLFATIRGQDTWETQERADAQVPARPLGQWRWVAYKPLLTAPSCAPGSPECTGLAATEKYLQEPCRANPSSSADNTGLCGDRDLSEGSGLQVRHMTAYHYPCYARHVWRYHWFVTSVHKVSLCSGEQENKKAWFVTLSGFQDEIGAVVCTHALRKPSLNVFIKWKRSLNVQQIWPGSTHDSFIQRNGSVGCKLKAGAVWDSWLIGTNH